ncbi:hypothetical protein FZI91_12430 [Mycobacterium sp. CBMA271]|uniref:hypothetical protein n=1 Tax=unclassified Mycobacteroides TaxID=2618759 RepID=UPI0012DEA96D|nr:MULTISPECIES: hypothetical protein [unclassified Mycobacteroides]MUM22500.1 hypothetical protein [Mycobacteroides sp. CBMA 271]
MADTSHLHPAVLHALRTGNLDQAVEAARLAAPARGGPNAAPAPAKSATAPLLPQTRRLDLEEDDFYSGFRSDPLGWRQ